MPQRPAKVKKSWFIHWGMLNRDGTTSKGVEMFIGYRSEKEAREAWQDDYPKQHPFFKELTCDSTLPNGEIRRKVVERRECFGPFQKPYNEWGYG